MHDVNRFKASPRESIEFSHRLPNCTPCLDGSTLSYSRESTGYTVSSPIVADTPFTNISVSAGDAANQGVMVWAFEGTRGLKCRAFIVKHEAVSTSENISASKCQNQEGICSGCICPFLRYIVLALAMSSRGIACTEALVVEVVKAGMRPAGAKSPRR